MSELKSANIRYQLTQQCASLGIPVSGTFELTPRCNLKCRMCYIRLTAAEMAAAGRELTAEEWLDLGKQARDAGMMFLLLTGGEPLLRPDFCRIYEGLTELGLSISINTNGSLITGDVREAWKKSPPASVNVTLYGTCRGDYEVLCGHPEVFDRVTENLDWLQDQHILVHLNTTIAPANLPHWKDLEAFAEKRSLELRMTTYCFPPRRREAHSSCREFSRLTPEQAARLTLQDILYREGPEALKRRYAESDEARQPECFLETESSMRCMAGKSMFWVKWNGSMVPCGMLEAPAADLQKTSFSSAWEIVRQKAANVRLCSDCQACPDRKTCFSCAAVEYTENGTFGQKPEYMCRYSRAYRAELERAAAAGFPDSMPEETAEI